MYVTRPLSRYQKFPSEFSSAPPEGPNSGILVIQDEDAEPTCCFGLCKDSELNHLPFPQNKNLTLRYSTGYTTGADQNRRVSYYFYAAFIPVINQPLSSNRYYVIKSRGRYKGEAYTSSKEDDMGSCCFCTYIRDVPPQSFDPRNEYQQFEIDIDSDSCCGGGFVAKPVAPDGFPPKFLRRKGWEVYTSTPRNYELGDASGLDSTLRARLPDFDFPLSCSSSNPVIVGKWYCPFIFIKEGTVKDQMSKSMYYIMTLEQNWEQIFACENENGEGNAAVNVDCLVKREVVSIAGREVRDTNVVDEVMWFRSFNEVNEDISIGLSLVIVERMKWEERKVGWMEGEEDEVRVSRNEEFGGLGGWRKFGCYILVERFALRRNDGTLVLTYDFKHSHQIKTKWE